jgi:hypothetical protein
MANISLGAITVDLAGAQVALNPIGINVSGQSGTPVGGIVCSLLNVVSSVGALSFIVLFPFRYLR